MKVICFEKEQWFLMAQNDFNLKCAPEALDLQPIEDCDGYNFLILPGNKLAEEFLTFMRDHPDYSSHTKIERTIPAFRNKNDAKKALHMFYKDGGILIEEGCIQEITVDQFEWNEHFIVKHEKAEKFWDFIDDTKAFIASTSEVFMEEVIVG